MRRTNVEIDLTNIVAELNSSPTNIFMRKDINKLLSINREQWRLPASITPNKFIDNLLKNTKLERHTFDFPHQKTVRYTWGMVSPYAIILSIKTNTYFTHHTAMYIHNLIDYHPDTIYLNLEQPPHTIHGTNLIQANIDRAFAQNVRISNNRTIYNSKNVILLNGMNTGRTGVIEKKVETETLLVTDIERTLIDIVVRPIYSGGVRAVLQAYREAKKYISVDKLFSTLIKLNYIYPYHQAIGFYLERSGVYERKEFEIFKEPGLRYNFYLTHKMNNPKFSPKWLLYYPKDF